MYLVSWVGRGERDNTWEAEADLPQEMVSAFSQLLAAEALMMAVAGSPVRASTSADDAGSSSPLTPRTAQPKRNRSARHHDQADVEVGWWRCVDEPRLRGTCTRERKRGREGSHLGVCDWEHDDSDDGGSD